MAKRERLSAVSASLEPLLSYKQMAAELDVSVRQLLEWVYNGVVPHFRLGHRTIPIREKGKHAAPLRYNGQWS